MFSQLPLAEHTLSHSHPSTNTRSYGHPCRKKNFTAPFPEHTYSKPTIAEHTLLKTPLPEKKNLQHHSPNTHTQSQPSPNTHSERHPCRKKKILQHHSPNTRAAVRDHSPSTPH